MDPREVAIQSAIRDLESGVYTSERKAAKMWGVKRSTLRSRRAGCAPYAIAHQYEQRLTPEQESFLTDWILDEDARAQPPSHARAREMASLVLQMGGDDAPLGKHWISHFIRRNPRISSVIGRSIEAVRAEASKPETIRAFLELFEATRTRLGIHTNDIWNIDETGVALGVCNNSRVLASASKHKAQVASPENREWVSILETTSAASYHLQPVVVFKGQSLQTTWFSPESIPDWFYTTSNNGWTSNEIGLEWLRRIFIPGSLPTQNSHRMLILDGHGSHVTTEFMYTCYQHKIHCLYLPAHALHILQPLDLTPFSITKSKYRDQIRALSALDDAAPVKKERFIQAYYRARLSGLSASNIRAGWRATGLVPYNPERVLSSSQVQGRPVTPPPPPQLVHIDGVVFVTPQKPRDVYKAQKQLERSEKLSRSTRLVLSKVSKSIAAANTRAAELLASNKRLQQQLNELAKPSKRKCIKPHPNERFVDIEVITAAVEAAATQAAKPARKTRTKAAKSKAATSATPAFDSMYSQWQI